MHIGLAGWSREATSDGHKQFLSLMEQADRLGFDSIWLQEFHFEREGLPYPSPILLGAAIAERTHCIHIGLSVALLPLHHPLLLAEMLAQLDYQSGGRLDVGVGRGTSDSTVRALGIDPATTRHRFVEAFDIIRRAWTESSVTHDGRFWQFTTVSVTPPVQRPHPPLFVAGYTPETIAFAVERELPLLLSLEPPEARQLDAARAVCAAIGRPYDPSPYSLTRYVCIGATSAEAEAAVDTLLPLLHRRRQWFAARRGEDPDALPVRPRGQVLREQVIAGTPDACIRRITELADEPGTGHLRCVFNGNGVLENDTALRAMNLFARDVLPACREIVPALAHQLDRAPSA
ncbi:MAG: LLM class flavin-dependent oxidoreductase [Chloroflexi bacterium]|nr:LLM class flavin-dependent oxidoreductase [Chloroflexota bacterium]